MSCRIHEEAEIRREKLDQLPLANIEAFKFADRITNCRYTLPRLRLTNTSDDRCQRSVKIFAARKGGGPCWRLIRLGKWLPCVAHFHMKRCQSIDRRLHPIAYLHRADPCGRSGKYQVAG